MTDGREWAAPGGTTPPAEPRPGPAGPPPPAPPAPGAPPGWGPPAQWTPAPQQWAAQQGWGAHTGWGTQPGWGQPRPPENQPGVIPLRPLGVGEILDGSLTTIRQHPKATLGVSAVIVGVTSLLQFGVQAALLRGIETVDTFSGTDIAVGVTASLLAGLVGLVGSLVISGALTIVIGDAVLGRAVPLATVWTRLRPRLSRLAGASLLAVLLGFIGLLLCVVPGIYLFVALSLATPALILEDRGVVASLRRSRDLVRGSWWRVFGILLLAALIGGVLQAVISTPFTLFAGFSPFSPGGATGLLPLAVVTLGGAIASTIVTPFTAGVTALLYVDRRMRAEGLDVTLAAAARPATPAAG